jgi:cell division protein FtsL
MSKNKKTAKTPNRKPLTLWNKVLIILCSAIVVGLILSVVLFYKRAGANTVSSTIELTFEGAAEGKAPDGYAFSVDDLTSDEIINAALERCNLAGKYTPEQVRKALVVSGGYPQDIIGQTMSYDSLLNLTASRTLTVDRFHPTLFSVTLYDRFDEKLSKAQQTKLLESLLEVYKEHFASVFGQGTMGRELAGFFTFDEYDYPQQLSIMQLLLNTISDYAAEMYERNPAFRYNGESFNDIVTRIVSIRESDLNRLNATMSLNALTKDPDRLLTQYQFEMRELENQLLRREQQLKKLDELIASYEKSEIIYISTEQSLTKIDGDSSKTYDALVDLRKQLTTDNTLTGSKISTYRMKISDLTGEEYVPASNNGTDGQDDTDAENGNADGNVTGNGNNAADGLGGADGNTADNATADTDTANQPNTPAKKVVSDEDMQKQREAFEKDVAALAAKTEKIASDYAAMIKFWNETKLNDTTVTVSASRYSAPKLVSGAFIKAAIKTTGPITALAVMVCLVMIIIAKRKELAAEQAK